MVKRVIATLTAILAIVAGGVPTYNTYSMIVDIHSSYATTEDITNLKIEVESIKELYATKLESRRLYFQTRVDDLEIELNELRSRRSHYQTRLDIEGSLEAGNQLRLDETIRLIAVNEPILTEFKATIQELTQ